MKKTLLILPLLAAFAVGFTTSGSWYDTNNNPLATVTTAHDIPVYILAEPVIPYKKTFSRSDFWTAETSNLTTKIVAMVELMQMRASKKGYEMDAVYWPVNSSVVYGIVFEKPEAKKED